MCIRDRSVDLAPGSTIIFSLVGTLDPTACGNLSNTATASSLEEIDPANNSSIVDNTIVKLADLSLTKTHTPEPVVPGSPVTYTVTVSNAGPAAVFGASFVDNLPPELLVPTWTCSVAGTGACSSASGSGNIAETLDLAPGASAIFTITGTVDQTVTSAFSNSAEVTLPPGVTDPDDSNNEAEDEATVDVQVDLEVLKSVTPANPVPGLPFTWTIEITNAGPSLASNFTFSDSFPPEALNPTWTCAVSGIGSCPAASGTGDICLLYTSPSPRDRTRSRMPSSA